LFVDASNEKTTALVHEISERKNSYTSSVRCGTRTSWENSAKLHWSFSFHSTSIQKKNKDNSPLKIVDEKSDDNDETIEEEIPNEMTVSKENDPDYSERSTSSDDEVDIVGGEDEYEKKTTCQKSFQNCFEHRRGTKFDFHEY
jgi:hypothetical protein